MLNNKCLVYSKFRYLLNRNSNYNNPVVVGSGALSGKMYGLLKKIDLMLHLGKVRLSKS